MLKAKTEIAGQDPIAALLVHSGMMKGMQGDIDELKANKTSQDDVNFKQNNLNNFNSTQLIEIQTRLTQMAHANKINDLAAKDDIKKLHNKDDVFATQLNNLAQKLTAQDGKVQTLETQYNSLQAQHNSLQTQQNTFEVEQNARNVKIENLLNNVLEVTAEQECHLFVSILQETSTIVQNNDFYVPFLIYIQQDVDKFYNALVSNDRNAHVNYVAGFFGSTDDTRLQQLVVLDPSVHCILHILDNVDHNVNSNAANVMVGRKYTVFLKRLKRAFFK